MNWTWEHVRHPTTWQRDASDPLDRFIVTVDGMFYVSVAALAIAVLAVLFG